METPFLKPEELRQREEKVPVSARISKETRNYLEAKAKEAKLSISNLVSHTLESYSKWLKQTESNIDPVHIDLDRVRITFETTQRFSQWEFDDYISFYQGNIFYTDEEGEEAIQLIGKILVRIWHLESAINNRESLFAIFDHEDDDTAAIYEAVIDGDSDGFKDDLIGENFKHDLMYIEEIEIVPEFRRHRLGHHVVLKSMQKLGHACGGVVISPVPWVGSGDERWKKRLRLDSFSANRATAEKRLRKYWAQIGFKPTQNKTFMIYDMEDLPPHSELFKRGPRG